MYSTWCGLGLTYDSHDYLAAAKSFYESGLLINKNGQAFIVHSPLLPILISGLGQNPLAMLRIMNLLFFTGTMIIFRELVVKNIRNEILRWCVYFAIVFAVGIHMIYNFVWSEPLFLFLFAFHNWFLIKYLKREKSKDLWILILLAFCMGITRNAGFFIILSSFLILFFTKKIRKPVTLYYFILGASGFAAWNMYTFFIQGGIVKFREGLSLFTGIGLNFRNYLDIISAWILPPFLPLVFRIILVFLLISFSIMKFKIRRITMEGKVFFFQSAVYTFMLIMFISVYKSDVERYMAVIYPWIFIGVFIILDTWILRFSKLFNRLLIVLICCWLSYVCARTIKNSVMWHKSNSTSMIIQTSNLTD